LPGVLITGSKGFIGSHLKTRFSDVVEFDLKEKLSYDIRNPKIVEKFWKQSKPDIVIHLAANPSPALAWHNCGWDAETNILGTVNVCEASLRHRVALLVYTSTAHVYDVNFSQLPIKETCKCRPRSPYAISKYAGELYCNHFAKRGLNVVILRLFNVYGPGQSTGYVVSDLLERLFKTHEGGTVSVLGPPDDSRDFVFVGDVVEAIKKSIEERLSGEIINIGSGIETSTAKLCQTMASLVNKNVKFSYQERPAGRISSRFQADIAKAKSLLNWEPKVSLREGIKITSKSLSFRGFRAK